MTADNCRLIKERDAARVDLAIVRVKRNQEQEERDGALAQVAIVIAERDAAERERTESRAEVVRLRAECEGLRADLLAHPPENAARIAELETANTALWEAQQQHQRKAEHDQIIIEGLRAALERTEKRLASAKSRQIPQALVGLLGVIRREAAAAEKMIL
jgi:hypothetical protein